jgi:hypothetical protein
MMGGMLGFGVLSGKLRLRCVVDVFYDTLCFSRNTVVSRSYGMAFRLYMYICALVTTRAFMFPPTCPYLPNASDSITQAGW